MAGVNPNHRVMRYKNGIITPCQSICRVEDGVCVGCGRTRQEIKDWRTMTEEERIFICRKLGDWEYNGKFGPSGAGNYGETLEDSAGDAQVIPPDGDLPAIR